MSFKIHIINKGCELNAVLPGAVPLTKTTHPVRKFAVNMLELGFVSYNLDNLLEHARAIVEDAMFEFGAVPEIHYYLVDDLDMVPSPTADTVKSLLEIFSESVTCYHHTPDFTVELGSLVNKTVYHTRDPGISNLLDLYMEYHGLNKLRMYVHPHETTRLEGNFKPDARLEFQLLPPGKKLGNLEKEECLLDLTANKISTFSTDNKLLTWECSNAR